MNIDDFVTFIKTGKEHRIIQLTKNLQFVMIDLSDDSGIVFRWVHVSNLRVFE